MNDLLAIFALRSLGDAFLIEASKKGHLQSDITFAIGESEFHLHRSIIQSSTCDYLKTLISGNFKEKGENLIVLHEISPQSFEIIVNIIYGRLSDILDKRSNDWSYFFEIIRVTNQMGFLTFKPDSYLSSGITIPPEHYIDFIRVIDEVFDGLNEKHIWILSHQINEYFDASTLNEDFLEILIKSKLKRMPAIDAYWITSRYIQRHPEKVDFYQYVRFHYLTDNQLSLIPRGIVNKYMKLKDLSDPRINAFEYLKQTNRKRLIIGIHTAHGMSLTNHHFINPYDREYVIVELPEEEKDKLINGNNRVEISSFDIVISEECDPIVKILSPIRVVSQVPYRNKVTMEELVSINRLSDYLKDGKVHSFIARVIRYSRQGPMLISGRDINDIVTTDYFPMFDDDNNYKVIRIKGYLKDGIFIKQDYSIIEDRSNSLHHTLPENEFRNEIARRHREISTSSIHNYNLKLFIEIQQSNIECGEFEAYVLELNKDGYHLLTDRFGHRILYPYKEKGDRMVSNLQIRCSNYDPFSIRILE